jgi:hypothetical protein
MCSIDAQRRTKLNTICCPDYLNEWTEWMLLSPIFPEKPAQPLPDRAAGSGIDLVYWSLVRDMLQGVGHLDAPLPAGA